MRYIYLSSLFQMSKSQRCNGTNRRTKSCWSSFGLSQSAGCRQLSEHIVRAPPKAPCDVTADHSWTWPVTQVTPVQLPGLTQAPLFKLVSEIKRRKQRLWILFKNSVQSRKALWWDHAAVDRLKKTYKIKEGKSDNKDASCDEVSLLRNRPRTSILRFKLTFRVVVDFFSLN